MSTAGKTTVLRAAMAGDQVKGKAAYFLDPEGALAIVPWSDWERISAVAKLEALEQCDPNGTWYDVAQAALDMLAQIRVLVKIKKTRLHGQDRGGNTYPVELDDFVKELEPIIGACK